MIKKINTYPKDKETLSKPCEMVEPVLDSPMSDSPFWGPDVVQTIENLKDTAQEHKDKCLGLCANQIWDSPDEPCPAIFISIWPVTTKDGKEIYAWREFINPVVVSNGPTIKMEEGCLSLPDRKPKSVRRKQNVTISFYDLKSAERQTMKVTGTNSKLFARILQHEYDHILGKII